jgi:hypothetical protein
MAHDAHKKRRSTQRRCTTQQPSGDHEAAHVHSVKAHEHSTQALSHSTDAHQKSALTK